MLHGAAEVPEAPAAQAETELRVVVSRVCLYQVGEVVTSCHELTGLELRPRQRLEDAARGGLRPGAAGEQLDGWCGIPGIEQRAPPDEPVVHLTRRLAARRKTWLRFGCAVVLHPTPPSAPRWGPGAPPLPPAGTAYHRSMPAQSLSRQAPSNQAPSDQAGALADDLAAPRTTSLQLRPFRALRYTLDGDALAAVTSPPYDVIDAGERDALAAQDPHNVVRLILPADSDTPGDRYARAAATLREWTGAGVLEQDARPALYVYEEQADGHVQRGIVGGVGLARADEKIVLPHESTMAGPVADRLALLQSTGVNLEPIVLAYEGGGATTRIVAEADRLPVLAGLTTADGVRHRLWAVTDPAQHAEIAADLAPRRATIADGHHRYATYLQYQDDQYAAGSGPGPWDAGLALLVDTAAFGPQVHAIHRVVADLALDDAAQAAARGFHVTPVPTGEVGTLLAELADAGQRGHAFAISDGSRAFLLTGPDPAALQRAIPSDRCAAWRELDVTVAHYLLVRDLWRLEDNEGVVGYRHDAPAALAAASDGGLALLLNPTPVAAVAAVAAAGDRMPRKSTLFTPKPRTGLLMRPVRDIDGGMHAG